MTKTPKLAREILSATGLTCLRVAKLAGHPNHSRVTIGNITDQKTSASRVWFRSEKAATRIINEAFADDRSRRAGGGLVFRAGVDETLGVLRHFAVLNGIALIEDAKLQAWRASLEHRIEGAMAVMGRDGTLKRLRRVIQSDHLADVLNRLN